MYTRKDKTKFILLSAKYKGDKHNSPPLILFITSFLAYRLPLVALVVQVLGFL